MDYSCKRWVSGLLRGLVCARVEAINFCDMTRVKWDASCELSGDLSVD